ncbi:MAG TPA: peptidoglycan bridge formation glycyltransferase FemA/FemB family protein [Drouetiella sp.]|jgi:peptidoglycan pentaglycine glycine transferase (the first glycine)
MALKSITLKDLGELEPGSPSGEQWDRLVQSNPASGFMQSTYWAQFKRRMGLKPYHLGVFDDGKLLGGGIFYTAPNMKGAGFLVAPDGPVLPWHDADLASRGLDLMVEALEAEASSSGSMALRIAPRLCAQLPPALNRFSKSPLRLIEHKTMLLDLQPEPQHLLEKMKPKARYNIGLAHRKGVTVYEESSLSASRKFYAVMQSVSARNNIFVEPLSFFIALIETLCPPGLARVFFAEHEGEILGALLMVIFGERATYLYGGTGDTKRNFMGGYALQWAAINAARNAGANVYDFWGYDSTSSPDNNYAGFSRFKSQFCGQWVELSGSLDLYFMDRLADVVIKAINEMALEA